jgi:hypothetical protein
MHNDGVIGRATFDVEDALHGCGVQGVGRQSINRFGRQGYNLTSPQQLHRTPERAVEPFGRVNRQNLRLQIDLHAASLARLRLPGPA